MLRQEYLISYDVEDSKVRTRLYKELEKYGMRAVQKSVFWGYLTLAELRSIRFQLKTECGKADKAFIIRVNFHGSKANFLFGHQPQDFRDWGETDVV